MSSRSVFTRAVAVVLLVTAGLVGLAAPADSAPTGIAPFLDCVAYFPSQNTLTAFFGYISANSGTIIISVGAENFVSPLPDDRGQTTTFQPGTHDDGWETTIDVTQTPSVTWTLLGQSITASNNAEQYCPVQPWTPGPVGPPGPTGPTGPTGRPGQAAPRGRLELRGHRAHQGRVGPQGQPGQSGRPGLRGLVDVRGR